MTETLRATFRRVLKLENRRRNFRRGRREHVVDFHSAILDAQRTVTVYLPAGYDERSDVRYPLLVMHDGQNLFDAERAFVPGNHWRLAEAADAAIAGRTALPMIIAGIDHGDDGRIDEYTPTHDEDRKVGGRADDHAQMLFTELLPMLNSRYRIEQGDRSLAVGGSSLGGLVSLHLALKYPDRIAAALAMSPSVWWNGAAILRTADAFESPVRPRLWLDIGLREGNEAISNTRDLNGRLRAQGWDMNTLRYIEDRRGDHSESAWAGRVQRALEFIYSPLT